MSIYINWFISASIILFPIQLGNMKRAAQYTRELLQYDPYHERAISNKNYFERLAVDEPDKFIDGEKEVEDDSERNKYEQLCREAPPLVSNLYIVQVLCQYMNGYQIPSNMWLTMFGLFR